jgi:hypothetical protein
MTMATDPALTALLKQAKSKKMFFAFIPKGGTDGKLIISKAKIKPNVIADAKKEIGGANAVTGKCTWEDGATVVFHVAKAAPPAMAATLKKVAKRDAGLAIDPEFQVAGDADAEEPETGAAPTAATPAPGATPPAAAAPGATPPAAAGLAGVQKALQTLGYDPGKIDGVMGPKTQAAIKKFQQANNLAVDGIAGPNTQAALAKALKGGAAAAAAPGAAPGAATPPTTAAKTPASAPAGATAAKKPASLDLGPWQAARQSAINDLKALAAKVVGTKHDTASAVVKEIQSIISRLPATPAPNDINKLEDFVRNDETITAAENVPSHFHDLDIRAPLLKALESLKQ